MAEDAENVSTMTPADAPAESGSYADALRGEGDAPEVVSGGETESQQPENQQPEDLVVEFELNGKPYRGKQSLVTKFLELLPAFEGNEQTLLDGLSQSEKLAELKKNYDKHFTQKTQEIGEVRKSLEGAFGGRIPDKPVLAAFGQMYQKSMTDPDYALALNAMAEGKSVRELFAGTPADPQKGSDPYTKQLEAKISGLEQKLQRFEGSISQERELKYREESTRTWNGWVADKTKQGIQITEEIDKAMSPFITALSQAHPDWDDNKILDEALRHATLGQETRKAVAKVLTDADTARSRGPVKITPKNPQAPDSSKTYGQIFKEG